MEILKKYDNIIKLVVLLVIFLFSNFIDLIPILIHNLQGTTISNETAILIILFRQYVIASIAIILYYEDLKRQLKDFKKNYIKYLDEGFKWWVIGLVIMGVSNVLISKITNGGMANNEESVREMINAVPYLTIILTAIFAPIIEELVFRKAFKDMFKEKWLFILTSGIVFGSLHVLGDVTILTDLLYIVPYSALGISFAYMYYKTNNIYTSISMHFLHNAIISVIVITSTGIIL